MESEESRDSGSSLETITRISAEEERRLRSGQMTAKEAQEIMDRPGNLPMELYMLLSDTINSEE